MLQLICSSHAMCHIYGTLTVALVRYAELSPNVEMKCKKEQ